jgi:hypothetical protein
VPKVGVVSVRRYLVVDEGGPGETKGFLANLLAELIESVSHRSRTWMISTQTISPRKPQLDLDAAAEETRRGAFKRRPRMIELHTNTPTTRFLRKIFVLPPQASLQGLV